AAVPRERRVPGIEERQGRGRDLELAIGQVREQQLGRRAEQVGVVGVVGQPFAVPRQRRDELVVGGVHVGRDHDRPGGPHVVGVEIGGGGLARRPVAREGDQEAAAGDRPGGRVLAAPARQRERQRGDRERGA